MIMNSGIMESPGTSVGGLLRRAARLAPATIAVAWPGGELSYRQLAERVAAVAALLPPATDGPEPIGVVAEHDATVPELYFGVLAAGHAVVPISARLPEHAVAKIATAAGIRVGLIAPSVAQRRASIAETADATRWLVHGEDERPASLPAARRTLPAGTAMVAFTSGTTGEPKGVILSHTNLTIHALTCAAVLGLGTPNVHVNPMPLAHFTGASRVIIAAVNAGTHVILPGFDPTAVYDAVAEWGGTHMAIVPTMAIDLLAADPDRFDLRSLQTLVYGAAPMPMHVARELAQRLRCDLFNGYGLTESCAMATALDGQAHRDAIATGDEQRLGSVGRAVPGMEVSIVGDGHRELAPGEVGQIALRGLKVSSGYLDRPEATAQRFLPSGWMLTGDQGHLSEAGDLTLAGRIDELIISGGINVQPGEIEAEALVHDGVASCAAFGVPSERWGHEVQLAVVVADGASVSPEDLRSFLAGRLDRYKVPKVVHFLEELPYTSVGKLQRATLASRLTPRASDTGARPTSGVPDP
jgi:long-chain acyl-CoA synthetase